MGDVLLQIVWVAAHHGLRREGAKIGNLYFPDPRPIERRQQRWRWTHELTHALGNPPAPGGPR